MIKIDMYHMFDIQWIAKKPQFKYDDFRSWIKSGTFYYINNGGKKCCITCEGSDLDQRKYQCNRSEFCAILERLYESDITYSAINSRGYRVRYGKIYTRTFLILTVAIITTLAIFNLKSMIYFFASGLVVKFCTMVFAILEVRKKIKIPYKKSHDKNLPKYTILLPLYKEDRIIEQLIAAISNIDYSKELLDIKLIIERDDKITSSSIKNVSIPDYFHLISVPYSIPRTKAKALNYAMHFSIGDYVVIYDAEDIPDTDQLYLAIDKFSALDNHYAALQASLQYYNWNDNKLTNLFDTEYTMWFSWFISGASKMKILLPLGGTSNHIKASILEEVGLWDVFNVTEDIELSMRFAEYGYSVGALESITLEEAIGNINGWMKQRTRWLKGYYKTFIDYFVKFHTKPIIFLNIGNIIGFYYFCWFSIFNFLVGPIIITIMISDIILTSSFYDQIVHYIMIAGTASLYFSSLIVATMKYKGKLSANIVLAMHYPIYFILHIFAMYRAVLHFFTQEHHLWEKTQHGFTLMKHRRKDLEK